MRKTLKFAGVLAMALSIAFTSCSNGSAPIELDSAVDTLVTLKTPNVTAKAYPGVNLVSWNPISNNEHYEVYRYENGTFTDKAVVSPTTTYYVDTDIQNNVKYTYKVLARGNFSSRAVYSLDSESGEASCTGILPPSNTSALNLAAYENGYDGKTVKTVEESKKFKKEDTTLYTEGAKLRVTVPAKAYLKYQVATSYRNKYDSTSIITWGTANDTVANDSILPINASNITSAGTYTVYVKAVSKNDFFTKDDIVELGSVTYESLGTGVNATSVKADYSDKGDSIRVSFTPVTINGLVTPTSMYKVYRNTYNTDLVEVTAPVVDSLSETTTTYIVDDPIADNTVKYTYTIVLTDGTKFGDTAPTKDVAPYALTQTNTVTIASAASTLDTDKLANDIKWTVTLNNVNQKFTAKVLTITDNGPLSALTKPVASDFTTVVPNWYSEANTTGLTYYAYTPNVPCGKTYLLVIVSEAGKKDRYVISGAVTVSAPTLSTPTITVNKYDSSLTLATPADVKKVENDIIINVKDSITVATDSIDNYTYKLYKTSSTVKADVASITFTANIADWTEVATIEMKSNSDYAALDTVGYVGVYKEENVADGTYAYKVIKSLKASGATKSSTIKYINIDTKDKATVYKPSIAVSYDDPTKANSNVFISWTKNTQDLTTVYGTGALATYPINFIYNETDEGITYALYRADNIAGATEVVYTRILENIVPSSELITSNNFIFKLDENGDPVKDVEKECIDAIKYKFTDENVPTSSSYSYIVVASKENAEPKISDAISLAGAN